MKWLKLKKVPRAENSARITGGLIVTLFANTHDEVVDFSQLRQY